MKQFGSKEERLVQMYDSKMLERTGKERVDCIRVYIDIADTWMCCAIRIG